MSTRKIIYFNHIIISLCCQREHVIPIVAVNQEDRSLDSQKKAVPNYFILPCLFGLFSVRGAGDCDEKEQEREDLHREQHKEAAVENRVEISCQNRAERRNRDVQPVHVPEQQELHDRHKNKRHPHEHSALYDNRARTSRRSGIHHPQEDQQDHRQQRARNEKHQRRFAKRVIAEVQERSDDQLRVDCG